MKSNKLKYAGVFLLSCITYSFFPEIIPSFVPITELMLRIAKLIVGPMIFIGVISSLIQIKTFRHNFKIIKLVFLFSILLTLVSILLGISLGSSFNLIPELIMTENKYPNMDYSKSLSLVEMLKTTIPNDIFNTITSTKILPIFLLSILFGTAVNSSDKSRQFIQQLTDHIYTILITISSGIKSMLYIPIYFILTVNLNKLTPDYLMQLSTFFLTFIIGIILLSLIVLPYLTYIMTGTSPIQLVKKSYIPLLTGFATMSSAITYPITLITLINKHKLNQHISTISLSLGTTLNMTGTAFIRFLVGYIFITVFRYSTNTHDAL